MVFICIHLRVSEFFSDHHPSLFIWILESSWLIYLWERICFAKLDLNNQLSPPSKPENLYICESWPCVSLARKWSELQKVLMVKNHLEEWFLVTFCRYFISYTHRPNAPSIAEFIVPSICLSLSCRICWLRFLQKKVFHLLGRSGLWRWFSVSLQKCSTLRRCDNNSFLSLSLQSSDLTTKSSNSNHHLWQCHCWRLKVGRSSDSELAVWVGQPAPFIIWTATPTPVFDEVWFSWLLSVTEVWSGDVMHLYHRAL